ncbi:MAG TPA: serpin family protein, partial [Polyangiales bacterium]|nr:serpin family protein [Polyangiales bacterium]
MPRVLIQSAACALVSCTLLACQASGAASPESVTSPAGSNASQPPAAGAAIQPSAAGEAAGVAGTAGMKPAVDAGAPSVSPVANAPQIARSSVAPNAQPVIADAEYPTFISHINQFGLELGQQLASGDLEQKNLVYSPLSATLALGMTYAGAKGRTATEMKTVLGDSFAPGVFHTAANRLMRELASRERESSMSSSEQPKLELNLADSIFVDRSLTLQASFLDLLSREYDIGVGQVDFSTASEAARLGINAWVQEQTKDKIKDLLAPDAITFRTRLVLVNALYF